MIFNEKLKESRNDNGFLKQIMTYSWQDLAIALIILIFLIFNFTLLSPLKSMPSPIYGGDYYYHLGYMHHLLRGGSILENSQLAGESPWAPFLYQGLIALFSKITGVSLIFVNLYSSLFFLIISLLAVYILSSWYFDSKSAGLIISSSYTIYFPIFKYTPFFIVLISPIFYFMVYNALIKKDWRSFSFAGLSYGMVGITSTMGFIYATVFLGVCSSYFFILQHISLKEKRVNFHNILNGMKSHMVPYALMILIGVLISMLYWFNPILQFHLSTPNHISDYDSPDLSKEGYFKAVIRGLKESFLYFNFSNTSNAFYSILFIASITGIILLLFLKQKKFKHTFLVLILASFLLSRFHFLFTIPLVGKDFFSGMANTYHMHFLQPMLLGVVFLYLTRKLGKPLKISLTIVAVILLTSLAASAKISQLNTDPFFQSGKSNLPAFMLDASSWIKANTNVNDVFLSTNEISFMMNSLTGNKFVTARRAHSGMWVDVDRRWADAAVILYGTNNYTRLNLLKKYEVKYVYWQYNWISLDYQFNQEGQLQNLFDPLMIRNINGYESYLADNGVKYQKIRYWLDPANRQPNIKQFDVLLVMPSNMSEISPWDHGLGNILEPKIDFFHEGILIARIYEIKI